MFHLGDLFGKTESKEAKSISRNQVAAVENLSLGGRSGGRQVQSSARTPVIGHVVDDDDETLDVGVFFRSSENQEVKMFPANFLYLVLTSLIRMMTHHTVVGGGVIRADKVVADKPLHTVLGSGKKQEFKSTNRKPARPRRVNDNENLHLDALYGTNDEAVAESLTVPQNIPSHGGLHATFMQESAHGRPTKEIQVIPTAKPSTLDPSSETAKTQSPHASLGRKKKREVKSTDQKPAGRRRVKGNENLYLEALFGHDDTEKKEPPIEHQISLRHGEPSYVEDDGFDVGGFFHSSENKEDDSSSSASMSSRPDTRHQGHFEGDESDESLDVGAFFRSSEGRKVGPENASKKPNKRSHIRAITKTTAQDPIDKPKPEKMNASRIPHLRKIVGFSDSHQLSPHRILTAPRLYLSSISPTVKYHVFNNMPINVVRVKDMQLLSRVELQNSLISEATAMVERIPQRQWKSLDKDSEGEPETTIITMLVEMVKNLARYAILSHRWGDDELDYETMKSGRSSLGNRKGYMKVLEFSKKAKAYNCAYIWFDTGCINKQSSSELEESIRSMYAWYRDAAVCIVYLEETVKQLSGGPDGKTDDWFFRGWTLQELLAPKRMKFFNSAWEEMNNREYDIDRTTPFEDSTVNRTFLTSLSEASGVKPVGRLHGFVPDIVHAREVLHWASRRQTSRPEDMAYCLVGLLGLQLPIIYGEGYQGAFYRLQAEVIQRSEDRGIFFWTGTPSSVNSMLAATVAEFQEPIPWDHKLGVAVHAHSALSYDPTITLTNFGIRLVIPIYPVKLIAKPRWRDIGRKLTLHVTIEDLGCDVQIAALVSDDLPIHTYKEVVNTTWFIGILGKSTNRYQKCFTEPFFLDVSGDRDLKNPQVIFVK
ncbi:hypothetical protein ONZ45_g790 [Pleurotus djamor]|nr:hypothetical protein ONZ45_g790 [Pleurotus djamor]